MAWTNITLPDQGKPTRRSLLSAIIDNFAYLYAAVTGSSTGSTGISNPSFEQDTDANDTPDNWTWSGFTGGTKLVDDTEHAHGAKSFKVTSPGGVGNGGGTLTMDDFFEVSPQRPFVLSFQAKSSVAGIKNLVQILWFDEDQASVSTTTYYSEDTNNPTDWTIFSYLAAPPATARYAKVKLTGCDNTNTTAGSVWFDDFAISDFVFKRRIEITTAGTWKFIAPMTTPARITVVGAGGGGESNGSGGGGGGGSVTGIRQLTKDSDYDCVVGAGSAGADGADSSWETTDMVAEGGVKGLTRSTGGAGGSGTGQAGDVVEAGAVGLSDDTTGNTGWGGASRHGHGGRGTLLGTRGGGMASLNGGGTVAGSAGAIIIEF